MESSVARKGTSAAVESVVGAASLLGKPRTWWSALTFSWVRPVLSMGRGTEAFQIKDLVPPPRDLTAATLAEELEAARRVQGRPGKGRPSLLRVLTGLIARRLLMTGVLRFLNTAVQFLPVLCLSSLLLAIQQNNTVAGMRAALALFCVLSTKTFTENQYFYRTTNVAMRTRAMLQAAIYSKSLRLPESAAAVPPVTLMQVDTGKVEGLVYSCHTLWDGIFQVLGYSFLLVRYLGAPALAGLALLAALLPLNARLNRQLSALNREVLKRSEARVSKTSEVLSGIRAIRQMGWDKVFEQEVCDLRDEELVSLRKRTTVLATLISTFSALPPFMTSVVLFAYALAQRGSWGTAFQPATIFAALALLDQIRFPLLFYPSALDSLAEGRAALKRITSFLDLDETALLTRELVSNGAHPSKEAERIDVACTDVVPLEVPQGRYVLRPFGDGTEESLVLVVPQPLVVPPGALVGIVGPVGSGKSTLVRALLGELPLVGLPVPSGKVAYCAQHPWIPTGTLRDIVMGGTYYDAAAFDAACEATAIDFAKPDDEISAGTLSGGQQARTALARAAYHARVGGQHACVFDDVTAALDPRVSVQVMEGCLFGLLRDCTRVVVTSDTGPLLRRCDMVVVMEAQGSELHVRAVGSYDELTSQGSLAPSLVSSEAPSFGNSVAGSSESSAAEEFAASEEGRSEDKEDVNDNASPVQLTVAEERAVGAVPRSLYARYFASANSNGILVASAATIVGTYCATVMQQWFIGVWTADTTMQRGLSYYLAGVSLLGAVAAMLTFLRAQLIATFGRRASRTIHRDMVHRILVRATTRYFDANPMGRILQRFAKDLEQVDGYLPSSLRNMSSCACTLAGSMATVAIANPLFIFALPPLAWIYVRALQYYLPVARELKRLEALARSPVYAEQNAAAEGVATIRQLRLGALMQRRAFDAIDGNTAVSYALKSVDRWFSFRMELLGNFLVFTSASLGILAASAHTGPWASARAAVAVTQTLGVVGLLNWTVRTVADTETSFSSFQRVVYTTDDTETEAPRQLDADSSLGKDWPVTGRISLRDVSLRYRADLPMVLQNVNLEVRPGQRVGIVGRTGSGKSTVLRVLLRTVEVEEGEGSIEVDGVDVRGIGLSRLRSAVTVIPQDNFLITGTVRRNVDPEGTYSDEDVQRALTAASLGHWPLDRQISAAGVGVSPGERQLMGVARALLRATHVVALDEVTSRVDEATDRKVQLALRSLPSDATVLVVSHRLETLLDYDSVVVMDSGRVVEQGSPAELSGRPGSYFARLLAAEMTGVEAELPQEKILEVNA